jgi:adhesin HecA-like repeat protein
LDISANTLNNQGGQLAAGANLNITANTLNNTQNTAQTQGGLIYAKNQFPVLRFVHLVLILAFDP